MSITRAIENSFRTALERRWDKTYWAFDIHGTMIVPNYKKGDIPTQFYPYVIEVMQTISKREDITTILYTCSHPDEIAKYKEVFKSHGIVFDFVNSNGDVDSQSYGCYDKKPYFNVLFEDKSGFDPMTDWIKVKQHLDLYPEHILAPNKKVEIKAA